MNKRMCRRGARISVWNEDTGESDILIVHECDIFSIGDQDFQVISLKPNPSLKNMPGSSNGYILIRQLP